MRRACLNVIAGALRALASPNQTLSMFYGAIYEPHLTAGRFGWKGAAMIEPVLVRQEQ
jgi:hypothetical protein